jgi:sugar diacid utilization regulator/putative methionine-R-sulfoxide reductase with GAF domain
MTDEKISLYEIIRTISAGPDLETILRGIVRLLTEATQCHACFVYFVEDDRLVLRAASTVYAHLEGRIVLARDEGLTGWVARTRRSAFIRDHALEDPRVRYVPELEEERFQSMVSVPVFARSGEVIGVINLHTEAPREFAAGDLEFLEHTASLAAGAIENARLYDNATRRVALLTDLSRVSHEIALAGSVDELVSTVTSACHQALGAERAEIVLGDGGAPAAAARWGEDISGSPIFVPLVAGDDRLGFLCVLLPASAGGSPEATSVLSAIASHTAVALRHHELIGRLREENLVKDFFEALSHDQGSEADLLAQGARLGCDLSSPHLVLQAVPWPGTGTGPRPWTDLVARLESSLSGKLPGAVFDYRTSSCRALIPIPRGREGDAAEVARRIYSRAVAGKGGAMTVGLSNVCREPAGFPRAFAEAASAAEVGGLIKGSPGVYTYEDLGPYRYVLNSEEVVRDRHQERLGRLVEYDSRRGSELLRTLDVYLEGRGNVVGTARILHTHPNTVRQRLARISRLCDLDLDNEDWLSLGIAVKIVKLRLARREVEAEQGGRRG